MRSCYRINKPKYSFTTKERVRHDEPDSNQGVENILKVIAASYERDAFSLKFKDPEIEADFLEYEYSEIKYFARVHLVELAIMLLVYFSFQTYKMIHYEGHYHNYPWIAVTTCLVQAIPTAHYLMMNKYKAMAFHFANINSCLFFIGFIELLIMGNPSYAQVDGFLALLILLVTQSLISYC